MTDFSFYMMATSQLILIGVVAHVLFRIRRIEKFFNTLAKEIVDKTPEPVYNGENQPKQGTENNNV